MKIDNDQIIFSADDFAGLSDIAKKSIIQRIGSLEDFARETGTIISRSIDADRTRLRREMCDDPQVTALIEKLSLTDEAARATAIAEVASKI